jgi:hypothetical protein
MTSAIRCVKPLLRSTYVDGPGHDKCYSLRQTIVALDCADRSGGGIGQLPTASSVQRRREPCAAGWGSWHPCSISRDASRVQWRDWVPSAWCADRSLSAGQRWLASGGIDTTWRSCMSRGSALVKDPVRCALMSGLSRGTRRWPSWGFADVPGTKLHHELKAHSAKRYCLNCRIDHSLSHHAVQRFLPDQSGLSPPSAVLRRSIIRPLTLRPRHHPSDGRPPCASSPPRRYAPSCLPKPLSPAERDDAPGHS